MDAITLDGILNELSARLAGRHLSRPRLAGPSAVTFETSASRDRRLWIDAGRGTAGVYWVARATSRRLDDAGSTSGRSRQAHLHLRKHVDGARVMGIGVSSASMVMGSFLGASLLIRGAASRRHQMELAAVGQAAVADGVGGHRRPRTPW